MGSSQDCSTPASSAPRRRDLRCVAPLCRGVGCAKRKAAAKGGVVFSSGVLADTEGVGPALAPVLELVEAVWIYRTAGDLPAGMTRLPSAGATASWSVEEVSTLQYQIGNEHSPTDRMGRQVLRIGADDRFEVQWYRRGGVAAVSGHRKARSLPNTSGRTSQRRFSEIAGELPATRGRFGGLPRGAAGRTSRGNTLSRRRREIGCVESRPARAQPAHTRAGGTRERRPSGWIEDQGEWHEL